MRAIKQIVREFGMLPWQIVDIYTSSLIWRAEYDKRMFEAPGDEKAAIAYADKTVRRTQPQNRLVDQAHVYRSGSFKKMMMTFKSQQVQNLSLVLKSARSLGYSIKAEGFKSKKTYKNAWKVFYYSVLCSLLFGAIRRRRLQKDMKEVGYDILAGNLGALWGISSLISRIEYRWGSDNALDSLLNELALIATSKKPKTKAKHAAAAVSQARGYPFVSVNRALTRESLVTKLLGGERKKKGTEGLRLLGGGRETTNRSRKLRLLQ